MERFNFNEIWDELCGYPDKTQYGNWNHSDYLCEYPDQ